MVKCRLPFGSCIGWKIILGDLGILLLVTLAVAWACRPKVVVAEAPAVTARRELATLRGRAEDGALAAAVSRVLRRYVMAALDFPPDELTTTELCLALQTRPQLTADLAANLGDFLRRCDEWKFAPAPPAPQLNAVQTALEWVEKIETRRNQIATEVAA